MLDLRLPIGYFFLINAVLLIGYGVVAPVDTKYGAGTINLNLIWGTVMLGFGLLMTGLGWVDKILAAKNSKGE